MVDSRKIVAQYTPDRVNTLMILHHLQNNNPQQYLTPQDLALTADYLNTTRGEIYGIASYYSMLSLKPRGRHIIRICNSPVCHMFPEINLMDEVRRLLQVEVGRTTADGRFTLEFTECIGCCAEAPAMMINGALWGNLSATKIRSIINDLRRNEIQS